MRYTHPPFPVQAMGWPYTDDHRCPSKSPQDPFRAWRGRVLRCTGFWGPVAPRTPKDGQRYRRSPCPSGSSRRATRHTCVRLRPAGLRDHALRPAPAPRNSSRQTNGVWLERELGAADEKEWPLPSSGPTSSRLRHPAYTFAYTHQAASARYVCLSACGCALPLVRDGDKRPPWPPSVTRTR